MIRLADGDRSAFDGVFAGLWPVVAVFCAKALPGSDAEDAAQLALVKIFDRSSTFDRDGDALTWALAIATWEIRTIRKRQTRSRTAELHESDCVTPETGPDRLAEEREIVAAARAVLETLSESDQQTLLATFSEDAPENVAGATLRKRRQRAIARLKSAWRRLYAE
jgi:RNA polymerase sigma-70 factor (ECF subfamily)